MLTNLLRPPLQRGAASVCNSGKRKALQPLFTTYDKDASGTLDYTEFAVAVFGEESAARG